MGLTPELLGPGPSRAAEVTQDPLPFLDPPSSSPLSLVAFAAAVPTVWRPIAAATAGGEVQRARERGKEGKDEEN